ncbi:GntR family transcriptional regulator [Micromonospora radicis]|uniref:GntR family transcriptional regulator n=1 Tax=Micromonospora radicis TaxID=1894971 RepID=A0A418MZ92_9ACTN|nr:GntR family transcriptional regulator [Micromonospora radicis]RIV40062.1 GntR family transcriptional regulator [Micromonospora radicis]
MSDPVTGPESPATGGRRGTRPKYRVIRDEIAGRIARGVYRSGQSLPAQRELCRDFGVTLMTLRQALQALSDEGLIVQQPGRGTYVTPPPASYRLSTLRSLTDELLSQGIDVTTEVLRVELRAAPQYVTAALRLDSDARVLRLHRLRLVDGTPLVHQVSWIAPPYARAVHDVDFSTTPLYEALAEVCGVSVAAATETIRPGVLSAALAPLLRRRPGTPIFLSDRLTLAVDQEPVVLDRAALLGDRLQIRADRVTSAMSLSWDLTS